MYMLDGLDLKFDFKVAEAASIVVLKIYVLLWMDVFLGWFCY